MRLDVCYSNFKQSCDDFNVSLLLNYNILKHDFASSIVSVSLHFLELTSVKIHIEVELKQHGLLYDIPPRCTGTAFCQCVVPLVRFSHGSKVCCTEFGSA